MAFPSNYQGCTVTGTYLYLDGSTVAGTITFTATPVAILDYAIPTMIVPRTLTVTLDSSGHFSIVLPATDDPDVSPQDFTYAVTENFPGGRARYSIEAPMGTTVDLVNVSPIPDAQGVPIIRGPRGYDGAIQTVQGQSPALISQNVDLSPVIPLLANNLSDLPSKPTSRANLGILSAALHPDTDFPLKAANLSDLPSALTARSNLGLGSVATHNITDLLQRANNLSDVANPAAAVVNLLGDTGWQAISFGLSWQGLAAYYRVINGVVYMKGFVAPTGGGNFATSSSVTVISTSSGALPTIVRPPAQVNFFLSGPSAASSVRGSVNADGSMVLGTNTAAAAYVDLSGFSGYMNN